MRVSEVLGYCDFSLSSLMRDVRRFRQSVENFYLLRVKRDEFRMGVSHRQGTLVAPGEIARSDISRR